MRGVIGTGLVAKMGTGLVAKMRTGLVAKMRGFWRPLIYNVRG